MLKIIVFLLISLFLRDKLIKTGKHEIKFYNSHHFTQKVNIFENVISTGRAQSNLATSAMSLIQANTSSRKKNNIGRDILLSLVSTKQW